MRTLLAAVSAALVIVLASAAVATAYGDPTYPTSPDGEGRLLLDPLAAVQRADGR